MYAYLPTHRRVGILFRTGAKQREPKVKRSESESETSRSGSLMKSTRVLVGRTRGGWVSRGVPPLPCSKKKTFPEGTPEIIGFASPC